MRIGKNADIGLFIRYRSCFNKRYLGFILKPSVEQSLLSF